MFQVDKYGKVIAWFRVDNEWTIFALQHLLSAVLYELSEAFDGEGDEDLGLGIRGGEVEGDAVKVRDDLVNGNWWSSGSMSACVYEILKGSCD